VPARFGEDEEDEDDGEDEEVQPAISRSETSTPIRSALRRYFRDTMIEHPNSLTARIIVCLYPRRIFLRDYDYIRRM
jgi:hypothetical protein